MMFKLSALMALFASTALATTVPQVRVENGQLAGKQDGNVYAYLGIPYAAAPVGANRWRAPQPAANWAGVRDASKYGNSCMQSQMMGPPGGRSAGGPSGPPPSQGGTAGLSSPGKGFGGAPPGATGASPLPPQSFSEDCLFANVWTSDVAPDKKMPVLVFFHGGGWNGGSGAGDSYAGASMAGHGIVMVTVNFRLGLFGFLANQWLLDEAGDTGNYGLQDEVAALQWVKRNIAAFGGDPNQVTIAGQSSGAAAVRDLSSIPAADGLFNRGIPESTPFWGGGPIPLTEALEKGAAYVALTKVKSLADLRALPADELQKLVPGGLPRFNKIGFLPVSGDEFFPAGAKERENITMMAGSNTYENKMNGDEWGVNTEAELRTMLQKHFKNFADRFAPYFSSSQYDGSVNAAAHAILADGPGAEVALVQRSRSTKAAPVYTYLWSHAEPGQQGASHGSELSYVYENLNPQKHGYTPEDFAISKEVNAYWMNFIKTGNPNGPGLPNWPEARSGLTMELGDHFKAFPMFSTGLLNTYKAYAADGGQFGLP